MESQFWQCPSAFYFLKISFHVDHFLKVIIEFVPVLLLFIIFGCAGSVLPGVGFL